jgi:hypothetical protein
MDINNVTLGEAWLKRAGGGALAVFAPSGLTDTYYGLDITREIFGDLYGAPKERLLGNAVAAATNFVCLQGNAQTCQNYALLGDPSVRMNLPTVAPPTNVTATGANLTVNLNWTASTTQGRRTTSIVRRIPHRGVHANADQRQHADQRDELCRRRAS